MLKHLRCGLNIKIYWCHPNVLPRTRTRSVWPGLNRSRYSRSKRIGDPVRKKTNRTQVTRKISVTSDWELRQRATCELIRKRTMKTTKLHIILGPDQKGSRDRQYFICSEEVDSYLLRFNPEQKYEMFGLLHSTCFMLEMRARGPSNSFWPITNHLGAQRIVGSPVCLLFLCSEVGQISQPEQRPTRTRRHDFRILQGVFLLLFHHRC